MGVGMSIRGAVTVSSMLVNTHPPAYPPGNLALGCLGNQVYPGPDPTKPGRNLRN